jgi:hypothetical protein
MAAMTARLKLTNGGAQASATNDPEATTNASAMLSTDRDVRMASLSAERP